MSPHPAGTLRPVRIRCDSASIAIFALAAMGVVAALSCRRAENQLPGPTGASPSPTSHGPASSGEDGSFDASCLVATVEAITPAGEFAGPMIPLDMDPRFVILLRLESDWPAGSRTQGQTTALGLHSIVKTFGEPAGDVLSRTFQFYLSRQRPTRRWELQKAPQFVPND